MNVYVVAIKIPNVFRNLLSEGALSAAFVPVLSSFLADGDLASARRLAQGTLGRLMALSGFVVAAAIAAAPWLVNLLSPGLDPEASALTTRLVRILFPMSGVMIAGGWCLGVLNAHRNFFLPFAAPILWNLAQICGLLAGARFGWEPLIVVLAWSTLAGSVLQIAVQLPAVRRHLGALRLRIDRGFEPTGRVARNIAPVAAGQGIFQISSLVDVFIGSFLATGTLAGLYFAQRLVQLPLALFGVAVAAAALPEMSREKSVRLLPAHLSAGTRRIAYYVFPSVAALVLCGDLAAGIIYQRGAFESEDVRVVQWIVIAYAVGVVPTSLNKLFSGAFFALQDTRTPVKYAALGLAAGVAVGGTSSLWLDSAGFGTRAAAGLALGSSFGAWSNFGLLARGIGRRGAGGWLPPLRVALARMALGAFLAGAVALPLRLWLEGIVPGGLGGRILLLAVAAAAGGVCYIAVVGLPSKLNATPASRG